MPKESSPLIGQFARLARNRPLQYAALFALIFFPFYSHSIFFRDSFILFGPNKFMIGQALRNFTVQTWNPTVFLGMPFVADPPAEWFYPLNP